MNEKNSWEKLIPFMDIAFILWVVIIFCLFVSGIDRVIIFSLCGIGIVLRVSTYFIRWKILKENKDGHKRYNK